MCRIFGYKRHNKQRQPLKKIFLFSSSGFCCEHATLSRQRDFAQKDCIVGFQHQQIIRALGKRSKHITSAADICGKNSFSLASSARPYWRLYQYLFSISAHRAFTFEWFCMQAYLTQTVLLFRSVVLLFHSQC